MAIFDVTFMAGVPAAKAHLALHEHQYGCKPFQCLCASRHNGIMDRPDARRAAPCSLDAAFSVASFESRILVAVLPQPGYFLNRSSRALMATITVLADISTAPRAGVSTTPGATSSFFAVSPVFLASITAHEASNKVFVTCLVHGRRRAILDLLPGLLYRGRQRVHVFQENRKRPDLPAAEGGSERRHARQTNAMLDLPERSAFRVVLNPIGSFGGF